MSDFFVQSFGEKFFKKVKESLPLSSVLHAPLGEVCATGSGRRKSGDNDWTDNPY